MARADERTGAKSAHVEDAVLQPFLQTDFDTANYLNATLPALTFSVVPKNTQTSRVSLIELSTQTQTLLSQLNAQTSRLTNTLNQLTDEILRGGSRLAYEVEILRGETAGLTDALNAGLRIDIEQFVAPKSFVPTPTSPGLAPDTSASRSGPASAIDGLPAEPEYIEKLRTLTKVRERLDSVIRIFGDAMQWPVAPSEMSIASSIISVSAPSAGGPEEIRDREEKGREYARKLREEISGLLETAASSEEGIAAATRRIEELNNLSSVWKSTSEEKPRARQIDNLAKAIDEEQKSVARRLDARKRNASPATMDYRYGPPIEAARPATQGGYGFIKNLQKLKDDIYLD